MLHAFLCADHSGGGSQAVYKRQVLTWRRGAEFGEKGLARRLQLPYNETVSYTHLAGYEQMVTLEDKSPEKEMYLEPWFVTQINPNGEIIVP